MILLVEKKMTEKLKTKKQSMFSGISLVLVSCKKIMAKIKIN
jgi:hypothetical protein